MSVSLCTEHSSRSKAKCACSHPLQLGSFGWCSFGRSPELALHCPLSWACPILPTSQLHQAATEHHTSSLHGSPALPTRCAARPPLSIADSFAGLSLCNVTHAACYMRQSKCERAVYVSIPSQQSHCMKQPNFCEMRSPASGQKCYFTLHRHRLHFLHVCVACLTAPSESFTHVHSQHL